MTVTHPCHPLCGQQVEVIDLRRRADLGLLDLIIQLPDGSHAAMAATSTDYVAAPEPEPPPGPVSLLDVVGLCQMLPLIAQLRQRSGFCTPDSQTPRPVTSPSDNAGQAANAVNAARGTRSGRGRHTRCARTQRSQRSQRSRQSPT